jgi:hypothetical protein
MRIPSNIIAGDSAQWVDVAFADGQGYPVAAPDYTFAYSLRGPGTALDLSGTAQGNGWAFALTPTVTAALNVGASSAIWYWQAYASKSGVRLTAGDGTLVVKPNLAALSSTPFDGTSQAEKILAAITNEMQARITGGATV